MREGMPAHGPRFNEGVKKQLEALYNAVEGIVGKEGVDIVTTERLNNIAVIMQNIKNDMEKDK